MRIAARSTPLLFAAAMAVWMAVWMMSCNAVSPQPYTPNDGGTGCDTGATQACECAPAGAAGVETCLSDGTWGPCDCTNTDPCGDGVLLVVDRSGSMGVETKWDDFMVALEDTLASYDGEVPMGLVVFPDEACDGTDPQNLDKLCRPPSDVTVDVAEQGLSDIADELEALGTCGGTPTAGALEMALDVVVGSDLELQVVLITDGLPNCNLDLDGATCECIVAEPSSYCQEHAEQCLDDEEAIGAAQVLYDSGAPVHVVGFSLDAAWIDVMDAIAQAGGTENSEFCPGNDALIIALERIFDSITDC